MNPITRIARWWLKLDSKCTYCRTRFHHAPVMQGFSRFCCEDHAAKMQEELAY